ncbi:hypothetical protein NKH18_17415 [Streptomyces sp. M10(2022)]
MKPFVFPDTGFDVRRIIGQADIQAANNYAVALSYDAGSPWTAPMPRAGPGTPDSPASVPVPRRRWRTVRATPPCPRTTTRR